jgi:polyisoprenoid-binding protein YceI
VDGTLEIHGIAKPVTVHTSVEQDPSGGVRTLVGHAVVRLRDYGLKPPSAVLGAIGTQNEMTVEFRLGVSPERSRLGMEQQHEENSLF